MNDPGDEDDGDLHRRARREAVTQLLRVDFGLADPDPDVDRVTAAIAETVAERDAAVAQCKVERDRWGQAQDEIAMLRRRLEGP
jgi:hypothetical protein